MKKVVNIPVITVVAKVAKILDDGLIFVKDGKEEKYEADTVVYATGLQCEVSAEWLE